jgi:hypothetical protein
MGWLPNTLIIPVSVRNKKNKGHKQKLNKNSMGKSPLTISTRARGVLYLVFKAKSQFLVF